MAKILLIEDDETMVTLLKTLLEMEGFRVAMVDGKDEILQVIQREAPDLILLDIHLRYPSREVISGLDLLDRIRTSQACKDIKVIMASGMDLRGKCLAAGANAFIMKPYMPDALIHLIKETLT